MTTVPFSICLVSGPSFSLVCSRSLFSFLLPHWVKKKVCCLRPLILFPSCSPYVTLFPWHFFFFLSPISLFLPLSSAFSLPFFHCFCKEFRFQTPTPLPPLHSHACIYRTVGNQQAIGRARYPQSGLLIHDVSRWGSHVSVFHAHFSVYVGVFPVLSDIFHHWVNTTRSTKAGIVHFKNWKTDTLYIGETQIRSYYVRCVKANCKKNNYSQAVC